MTVTLAPVLTEAPPRIFEVVGGWAAVGDGWAVFADTIVGAEEKYEAALELHREIAARDVPQGEGRKSMTGEPRTTAARKLFAYITDPDADPHRWQAKERLDWLATALAAVEVAAVVRRVPELTEMLRKDDPTDPVMSGLYWDGWYAALEEVDTLATVMDGGGSENPSGGLLVDQIR